MSPARRRPRTPLPCRRSSRSPRRNRTVAALVGVAIVTVMLLIGDVFSAMRTIGTAMFKTLAWLGFAFCLFAGLRNTVDCLSSEKREGTLGLLFLTELTGVDVVVVDNAPPATL